MIDTKLTSIEELFRVDKDSGDKKLNRKFIVPNYQREYKWSKDEVEKLFNDIINAYNNRTIDENGKSNDEYFLGTMIFVDKDNQPRKIIDGQQRITTLLLLFDLLSKKDIKKFDNYIFVNGIREDCDLIITPFFDKGLLSNVINMDIGQIDEQKKVYNKNQIIKQSIENRLVNTVVCFNNCLKDAPQIDEDLVDFILHNIKIVVITTDNEEQGIRLYLAQNDRGAKLDSFEIFKANAMGALQESSDKNEIFDMLESISKENSSRQMTNDSFLSCYIYYKLKENPKKSAVLELSELYNKEADSSKKKKFISDMNSFSDILKNYYNNSSNKIQVYRMRYIPWQSYVMALYAYIYNKYDGTDQSSVFKLINKFYYKCLICKVNMGHIKQSHFDLIEAVSNKSSILEINNIIDKYNESFTDVDKFLNGDAYNSAWAKPCLLALEYTTDRENFIPLNKDIHLDHILPKEFASPKAKDGWQHITNFLLNNQAERSKYLSQIMNIGNLAILKGNKNIRSQNYSALQRFNIYSGFDKYGNIPKKNDKQQALQTSFNSTQKVLDEYYDKDTKTLKKDWDFESIKNRTIELINEIKQELIN